MAYLRFSDLKDRGIRFSRQHLLRQGKAGKFPLAIKFGGNTNVWLDSEIAEWEAARKAERDARAAALKSLQDEAA